MKTLSDFMREMGPRKIKSTVPKAPPSQGNNVDGWAVSPPTCTKEINFDLEIRVTAGNGLTACNECRRCVPCVGIGLKLHRSTLL